MRAIITKIIMAVIGIAALSSCNHKDLCYEHIHKKKIRVAYDWREAPDATPAGMCVFFYSLDNADEYYRFDFNNIEGGEIEIPMGRYELITYNNDTEIVQFNGVNIFDAHKAYTRTGDLLEPLYGNGITSNTTADNDEEVRITPDALWGCHTEEIDIEEHGVTYTHYSYDDTKADNSTNEDTEYQTITLYPHDMLCHYSYEVRNVENIEHISQISAALSGMTGSMTLADEKSDSQLVTLPLSATAETKSREITGHFLTFGQNPQPGVRHKMTFYVVMDDGSKYVVKDFPNLDVTTQVDEAPDQKHVHIIIDSLKLPNPGAEDDGWLPTVDDWGITHEDIKV